MSKELKDEIELCGWKDLIIPSKSITTLTSRAYKLYSYLIFRARGKESSFPGVKRIADDLTFLDENWSEPTVKRYLKELSQKYYIRRTRRIGSSSLTQVFKNPDDCRRITHDTTARSSVIRHLDHPVAEIKSTKNKENKEEVSPTGDAPPQKPKRNKRKQPAPTPEPLSENGARTPHDIATRAFYRVFSGRDYATDKAADNENGRVLGQAGAYSAWWRNELNAPAEDIAPFYAWYREKHPDTELSKHETIEKQYAFYTDQRDAAPAVNPRYAGLVNASEQQRAPAPDISEEENARRAEQASAFRLANEESE